MFKNLMVIIFLLFAPSETWAQNSSIKMITSDGTFVIGFVDDGAFLNFTGPSLSYQNYQTKILIGMLPSLRFKKDNGNPKNSFVTPSLGIGITYLYQNLALQIPCYYQAKTNTTDGLWHVGLGIGFRLNFNSKSSKDDTKI